MHRVILFDRYRLFVDAVDAVLRRSGIDVLGKTTTRGDALDLIESRQPDLLLVGLGEPGSDDALELLRTVTVRWPKVKKIVIGRDGDAGPIEDAFAAGATAFVATSASLDDITFAIKQSFDHSIHFAADRHLAPLELEDLAERPAGLSERELEILRLVGEGRANSEVARELRITEQTVKFHLSNIYRKLGVTNRTQASRRAQQLNLFSLGTEAEAS